MKRFLIHVTGIVQGVGFRPFVYNLANRYQLTGFVTNSSEGVTIEIQGDNKNLLKFLKELKNNPPVLSQIDSAKAGEIKVVRENTFKIKKSKSGNEIQTLISPDTSICKDCRDELFNKTNRRYHYPFINCTNCGPRFTIIKDIPYDRPKTTMADFKMCPKCQSEYDDPANRRFHAQPNACPECGPQVWLEKAGRKKIQATREEAISKAVDKLIGGEIVAVKGLGGFHLMVDAKNEKAVIRLRERKSREEKALAIMVPDQNTAEKFCNISESETISLQSFQSPIVILKKKKSNGIAESVAPRNPNLGIMLPYTPLHHLILQQFAEKQNGKPCALVATSGNLTEEPIAITNDGARKRLKNIADFLLLNDRDILVRSDDSVIININKKNLFYRRSRGFAPKPVRINNDGPDILGVGADMKNAICVLKNNEAFLSQHIGDLENLLANKFFNSSIGHIQRITSSNPEIIAYDMHPGYASSQWAMKQKKKVLFPVQHHHAHMASVMAEYELDKPVIGIILDGTGYGYDKTIWGGEVFSGDYINLKRQAYLQPMPLPGGDAAIKYPWRMAVAYLYSLFGERYPVLPFMNNLFVDKIIEMTSKDINCIQTSSCGRLFDAVAVMIGGCKEVHYEAQAAIEMMNKAIDDPSKYEFDYHFRAGVIPLKMLISRVVEDVRKGTPAALISTRFHNSLISIFIEVTLNVRKETGINDVVLSGGVFQNSIFLAGLWKGLSERDFHVHVPEKVPVNDGAISFGQAVIARHLHNNNLSTVNYEQV